MRLLALALLALAAAAGAAWFAQTQGGEVIVHSGALSLRTSAPAALLAALGALFGFYLLVAGLSGLLRLPGWLRRRRRRRRRERAAALFARGLRELFGRDWEAAARSLEQALEARPNQPLARLAAARACLELERWEAWDRHLRAVTDPACAAAARDLRVRGLRARGAEAEAQAVQQAKPAGGDA